MIEPYFIMNNRKSLDFDIKLKQGFELILSSDDVLIETAPGLNRRLLISRDRKDDIERSLSVRMKKNRGENIFLKFQRVGEWLKENSDYTDFYFSEIPDYFYKAVCLGSITAPKEAAGWLDFQIPFSFQPYMFKSSGAFPISVTNGSSLNNPESYFSEPVLSFYFDAIANGSIIINGNLFQVDKTIGKGNITIDSTVGIAYREGGQNISKSILITQNGYQPPKLQPGKNKFYINSAIQNLKVTPNWRRLAV
ncbi:hypothetical protein I6N96_01010 [Enterococcus sp. BWM-S5]|uniref:Phage tail protein n=1 Tax=Enterococcus larvae TaxID=2794352 RepID=A0ABS4CEC4_9ENTE|nr:hypothetical protein [Enterococcus larvae]MBP1044841.1 hypothetical protein [Enterococcus larvae]